MEESAMDNETPKLEVEIATTKPRKKRLASTAFKPGNSYAIQPGEKRNPHGRAGKTKDDPLVSKALRVQLNNRAPDDVCRHFGLPHHSSWSQCLAARLIRAALQSDISSGSSAAVALEMLLRLTEPKNQLAQTVAEATDQRETISIEFVQSNGEGRPMGYPKTIDAQITDPDPDPDSQP
jgi:hypothetical protein